MSIFMLTNNKTLIKILTQLSVLVSFYPRILYKNILLFFPEDLTASLLSILKKQHYQLNVSGEPWKKNFFWVTASQST